MVATPQVKGNNPAWFTKMDINGDGDISPKEWLGDEETFNEIDTDKDGLISAAEARAFEAKKPKDQTKEPAETGLDAEESAEFYWSKSLYRARKAAKAYSEETHADY